jgi:hypothetical protein
MSQDFGKGKIYKITNDYNDDVYVGSTCDLLTKRFSGHKKGINSKTKQNTLIYKLMNEIGFERFRIELIEDFPCQDKYQLRQREGHFIRELGTLNMRIECRTDKEYQKDNKDKKKEIDKKYNENNKQKIQEYHKEYYEVNKEKIQEYRGNNKEKIQEKAKEYYKIKITCNVCGSIVCKRDISKHIKTSKHQSQMPENYEN